MKAKLPRESGIYQILCKPTGKIYIGSTVSFRERQRGHWSSLRCGKHPNIFLQRAWDKYGEPQFAFSVLEFVDETKLLQSEQVWIDRTGCAERKMGFNISRIAGSIGDLLAQVWEGFIDPEGNQVTITNLHSFCRQHGLDFPSMHRLAKGKSKLKSYKGWTHRNSVRQRDYVKTYTGFIDPDGRPVKPITNLATFCREHGLGNTHMVAVAHGRICSHRGWTHKNGRRKSVKIYSGFINPEGQRVIIENLMAFCRMHGLKSVRMHNLISGQRKSHKGWTWRENE